MADCLDHLGQFFIEELADNSVAYYENPLITLLLTMNNQRMLQYAPCTVL